jgi:hypothetical protein
VNPRDAMSAQNQGLVPESPPDADTPAAGGSPQWRQLSFRASGLSIELEITHTGPSRRLTGQLIPRQPAVVDIRHGEGVISVEADTIGHFSADAVPVGPVSLRCRLGPGTGRASVRTGWVSVLSLAAVRHGRAEPTGRIRGHPSGSGLSARAS